MNSAPLPATPAAPAATGPLTASEAGTIPAGTGDSAAPDSTGAFDCLLAAQAQPTPPSASGPAATNPAAAPPPAGLPILSAIQMISSAPIPPSDAAAGTGAQEGDAGGEQPSRPKDPSAEAAEVLAQGLIPIVAPIAPSPQPEVVAGKEAVTDAGNAEAAAAAGLPVASVVKSDVRNGKSLPSHADATAAPLSAMDAQPRTSEKTGSLPKGQPGSETFQTLDPTEAPDSSKAKLPLEEAFSKMENAVRSPAATAPAATPPAASMPQLGKIDSAISAEIAATRGVETVVKNGSMPAKLDKYSVSGRVDPAGTRHARSERSMSSLPFPPSAELAPARPETLADVPRLIPGDARIAAAQKTTPDASSGADSDPSKLRAGEPLPALRTDAPAFTVPGHDAAPTARATATDASHTLQALQAVVEKTLTHPGKPMRIELELPVQHGDPVWVRLELRDGTVHTVFRTDSPDLRDALQQAWPQFSQRSQDRGLPLGEAKFESSWGQQQQSAQQDHNHSRQAPREPFFFDTTPRPSKTATFAAATARQAARDAAPLSLWA
jgi:hypothetical protein